jgi:hypothetical protein
MCAVCDNIEDHRRNERFLRPVHSAVDFASIQMCAVCNHIEDDRKNEYFSKSFHSAVEFTSI